jgi:hypothetical protein
MAQTTHYRQPLFCGVELTLHTANKTIMINCIDVSAIEEIDGSTANIYMKSGATFKVTTGYTDIISGMRDKMKRKGVVNT